MRRVSSLDRGKPKAAMYWMLRALMLTVAFKTAAAHGEVQQAGTTPVTFHSSTFSDFRQLLARETANTKVTVRAYLSFPEETKDRYPTVVIVHTIGGYRQANEGYVAALLRKSGFATFTYDSFASRGTTGPAMSG